jgi:hypothetical protein
MNTRRILPALFLCIAVALPARAQTTFVVMSMKGKVEAASGSSKTWKRVTVGQTLGVRDAVRTSYASYVKLLVNGERLVGIDENTTRPLAEFRTPAAATASSATGAVFKYAVSNLAKSSGPRAGSVPGAVRGGEPLFSAVFPKYAIMTTTPAFRWVDDGGASGYDFILRDDSFAVIHRRSVDAQSLDLASMPALLAPGRSYHWQVQRKADAGSTDIVTFSVLPADTTAAIRAEIGRMDRELEAMRADDVTLHLVRAMYYEQKGLYVDAFAEYKRTIALRPESDEYREMMKRLLYGMNLYLEEEALMQ